MTRKCRCDTGLGIRKYVRPIDVVQVSDLSKDKVRLRAELLRELFLLLLLLFWACWRTKQHI